jgi:hypothetical protein
MCIRWSNVCIFIGACSMSKKYTKKQNELMNTLLIPHDKKDELYAYYVHCKKNGWTNAKTFTKYLRDRVKTVIFAENRKRYIYLGD